MEPLTPAEKLPELYRAILDSVAELERLGERQEAARVRGEASRIYSRSWDEPARRRLEAILRRADRTTAARDGRRSRGFRGRIAAG
jgi:hypothetical protein